MKHLMCKISFEFFWKICTGLNHVVQMQTAPECARRMLQKWTLNQLQNNKSFEVNTCGIYSACCLINVAFDIFYEFSYGNVKVILDFKVWTFITNKKLVRLKIYNTSIWSVAWANDNSFFFFSWRSFNVVKDLGSCQITVFRNWLCFFGAKYSNALGPLHYVTRE